MKQKTVGFAMCGSFCTFAPVLAQLEQLAAEYETVIPILSATAYTTDSRFGAAADFRARIRAACGMEPLHTLPQVEPFGPKKMLDILVIAPCTGNTLAKLACGIADTSVTLACKAHLRNARPVVLGVSTNDGLSGNAESIGQLLARKHIYFIPFGQDAPEKKPTSLVAHWKLLPQAVEMALVGQQMQPLLQSGAV